MTTLVGIDPATYEVPDNYALLFYMNGVTTIVYYKLATNEIGTMPIYTLDVMGISRSSLPGLVGIAQLFSILGNTFVTRSEYISGMSVKASTAYVKSITDTKVTVSDFNTTVSTLVPRDFLTTLLSDKANVEDVRYAIDAKASKSDVLTTSQTISLFESYISSKQVTDIAERDALEQGIYRFVWVMDPSADETIRDPNLPALYIWQENDTPPGYSYLTSAGAHFGMDDYNYINSIIGSTFSATNSVAMNIDRIDTLLNTTVTNVSTLTTNLSTESDTRASNDTRLEGLITTESQTRANSISSLSYSIQQEILARTAADTALLNRTVTLETVTHTHDNKPVIDSAIAISGIQGSTPPVTNNDYSNVTSWTGYSTSGIANKDGFAITFKSNPSCNLLEHTKYTWYPNNEYFIQPAGALRTGEPFTYEPRCRWALTGEVFIKFVTQVTTTNNTYSVATRDGGRVKSFDPGMNVTDTVAVLDFNMATRFKIAKQSTNTVFLIPKNFVDGAEAYVIIYAGTGVSWQLFTRNTAVSEGVNVFSKFVWIGGSEPVIDSEPSGFVLIKLQIVDTVCIAQICANTTPTGLLNSNSPFLGIGVYYEEI